MLYRASARAGPSYAMASDLGIVPGGLELPEEAVPKKKGSAAATFATIL